MLFKTLFIFSSSQLRHTNQSEQRNEFAFQTKQKTKKKKRHHIIKRSTNELRHPSLRKMHVLT